MSHSVTRSPVQVYSQPHVNAQPTGSIDANANVRIVEQMEDGKWGMLEDGSFIQLGTEVMHSSLREDPMVLQEEIVRDVGGSLDEEQESDSCSFGGTYTDIDEEVIEPFDMDLSDEDRKILNELPPGAYMLLVGDHPCTLSKEQLYSMTIGECIHSMDIESTKFVHRIDDYQEIENSLPVIKFFPGNNRFVKLACEDRIKDGSVCPICQDDLANSDYVRNHSCGHCMHAGCAEKAMTFSTACPICRVQWNNYDKYVNNSGPIHCQGGKRVDLHVEDDIPVDLTSFQDDPSDLMESHFMERINDMLMQQRYPQGGPPRRLRNDLQSIMAALRGLSEDIDNDNDNSFEEPPSIPPPFIPRPGPPSIGSNFHRDPAFSRFIDRSAPSPRRRRTRRCRICRRHGECLTCPYCENRACLSCASITMVACIVCSKHYHVECTGGGGEIPMCPECLSLQTMNEYMGNSL